MSLYKRKDSPYWWIKLTHNGRTVQESTKTRDQMKARAYEVKREAELWDEARLGVKRSRTWEEARNRWLDERADKKSIRDDIRQFGWLAAYLCGWKLSEIDRSMVERITQVRRREGVSNATVNRTLALLRSVLRAAVYDWEWLNRAPKVKLLREPKGRVRFLNHDELPRLLAELPSHLETMTRFSLLTGQRQRNVREMRWTSVDLKRRAWRVEAHEAKGGTGIPVPLCAEAVAIVAAQVGKHPVYVFTFRGEPLLSVNNTAWRSALKRAGIENFRWHDLRHTWATAHSQAGTPMHVLQELGGWASPAMLRRYAHHTTAHLTPHVDAFAERFKLPAAASYDSATVPEEEEVEGT
ncbi:MAG: site-specific integrase [Steroidobacteraceae bacterium]